MIRPDEWLPVDALSLEPNALSAARETAANVVVAAGPGAGKTELLAQRADYLFRTGACPYPRRILAISFKVDAARNLRTRVRTRSGPRFAARFDSFTFHAFAKRIIDNYRPALTGVNVLNADYRIDFARRIKYEQITFTDMVPLALEILETNKYAREALRQTYSHVFMDEFQDATTAQYSFLRAAFGGTGVQLTGVGDTKQRIMGFAGAREGVMDAFAEDFSANRLQLYQNYRSKPRLRRMQNRMVLAMDRPAAIPEEELRGADGTLRTLRFRSDEEEAATLTTMIRGWLNEGIPPREITVLTRQQPHLVAAKLTEHLAADGIAYRNEQQSQDLAAEPAAAMIFSFLRVVADDGQPKAYTELVRMVTKDGDEDFDGVRASRLRTLLSDTRATVRAEGFDAGDAARWKPLISTFLEFVSRPSLASLSPSYQQGSRLDDVISDATAAFYRELAIDGNPIAAFNRLSEEDAIRILTVHKCKGLEFEKVVVLGVEEELFWGSDYLAEFFVAISRAKDELVLTLADLRTRPSGSPHSWREHRTPHKELLAFATET